MLQTGAFFLEMKHSLAHRWINRSQLSGTGEKGQGKRIPGRARIICAMKEVLWLQRVGEERLRGTQRRG